MDRWQYSKFNPKQSCKTKLCFEKCVDGEFRMKSKVPAFTQDKQNKCYSSNCDKYEKSIRATNDEFSVAYYEIFKVVRKST